MPATMDGHTPFYPASMYTKDFQAGLLDGEIPTHAHQGFMTSQSPACYYACSGAAQGEGQQLVQGYFGGQAMTVVDQDDQDQQTSFSGSAIEQHLLHPAFSQHLHHLQQQQHHQQNPQHCHHHHHHHHLLHYGVDEVAAHLATSQAERLHQSCEVEQQQQQQQQIQQRQQLQQQHIHHQQQQVTNASFSLQTPLHSNNQTRQQQSYLSRQGHHYVGDQAAHLQQALLMETVLSNLPAEDSPRGDGLLSTTGGSNNVHSVESSGHLSPMQSDDLCKDASPPMDLELTCKQHQLQQQQHQQQQQPLPFPWMKTTKSHAHQWKAQWPGEIVKPHCCYFYFQRCDLSPYSPHVYRAIFHS